MGVYERIANLPARINGIDLQFKDGRATWPSSEFGNLEMAAVIRRNLVWTQGRGVSDVYAMIETDDAAHRSLPTVVRRIRRRKAYADEVGGMAPYRRHAFIRNILSVCRRKPETRSELRSCKFRERFINSHLTPRNSQPERVDCSRSEETRDDYTTYLNINPGCISGKNIF